MDTLALKADLAAAFRLADHFGFSEGICNHFSVMTDDARFILNRHGIHWSRLTQSDMLVVDPASPPEGVEITALNIHGAIHAAHPAATCVLHTHMPYATALTCLDDPRLRPLHQNACRFYDDIAYDHDYNGLADTRQEGERLARCMGSKRVLFMANHGVIVVGPTIASAFDNLYYLERACQFQVLAMSTGQHLREISGNVAATTKHQFDTEDDYAEAHFKALKTLLEPDYLN
ncbi:MAG: class II aldolase/adducin family protein [Pseudomonadota bacterium]